MRVLVFAASLRKASLNLKLAKVIVKKLEASGVSVDHADFHDFDMPLYDGDLQDSEGLPPGTQELAKRIEAADGVVIVSPEYNHGVPAPLKNAIDWISRVRPVPTKGKVFFLAAAAPSLVGGSRGIIALWPSLTFLEAWIAPKAFTLAQANKAFDDEGGLSNPDIEKLLDTMLADFVRGTKALSAS